MPLQFKIGYLWLLSLYEVFTCFHINGQFRKASKRYWSKVVLPTDSYFTYDVEDNDEGNHSNSKGCLGLGDFTFYDLLILPIMHPD
ncbi:unnamed protein product [Rotaria magnacalcarata]